MTKIDQELLDAARGSANFGLLAPIEPLLTIYDAGAESTVYVDPNGALIKCRQFGEVLAEEGYRSSPRRSTSRLFPDRFARRLPRPTDLLRCTGFGQ
jgi:type I restriction enzyme R subunit